MYKNETAVHVALLILEAVLFLLVTRNLGHLKIDSRIMSLKHGITETMTRIVFHSLLIYSDI